jgi:hypothetical protein
MPDNFIETDTTSRPAYSDPTAAAAMRNLERWLKEKRAAERYKTRSVVTR